mmetsp:Transcript_18590/g.43729  ORF Transcript_18590/g.43729 Transcript_18590/m.43729 type:complete len:209 (+) Transcript_18590:1418-2044(+)
MCRYVGHPEGQGHGSHCKGDIGESCHWEDLQGNGRHIPHNKEGGQQRPHELDSALRAHHEPLEPGVILHHIVEPRWPGFLRRPLAAEATCFGPGELPGASKTQLGLLIDVPEADHTPNKLLASNFVLLLNEVQGQMCPPLVEESAGSLFLCLLLHRCLRLPVVGLTSTGSSGEDAGSSGACSSIQGRLVLRNQPVREGNQFATKEVLV